METNQNIKSNADLDQLLRKLKKEDTRNLELTTIYTWIMWILAAIHLFLTIVGMILGKPSIDQLGFIFFSLGFLAFGFLVKSLNLSYKSVDYGIPTIEMLRDAAFRYKLWQGKSYLTLIPISLICIAASLTIQKGIPHPDQTTRLLFVLVGFVLVMIIAFYIGYLTWRKKQKPLRDKALALLAEIEK